MADEIDSMTFPEDSAEITFEMFDIFKNKTIHVQDWFLFMTISYNYMQLTPLGVQRLNWDVLNNSSLNNEDFAVFQFDQEQQTFKTRLYDWITNDRTLVINYKEYLAWFMQLRIFDLLKNQQFPARTNAKSVKLTFQNLGLRLTKANFNKNVRGLDSLMQLRLV